ncbi:PHLOEM PROTEIN 2-LIKE A6 [Nymphaea thermarum]|nr:PHLOEM PROTEIN 2-LIKE A6 [Nymphaea thermarum]
MLPPDLPALLSRAVSPISFSSKKELFFLLCSSPLIIDSGKRSFSLDRGSGKKCFMISAKELSIMLSEDESCWRWISLPNSRFSEVADLLSVWWLEIRAAIKATELSPHTWYAAYFVLKHKEYSSGFNLYPVELALSTGDGTYVSKREAFIHPDKRRKNTPQPSYAHTPPPYGHIFGWLPDWPRGRRHLMTSSEQPPPSNLRPREGGDDGWMEVEIGAFYTNGGEDGGGEVEFSLLEVNGVVKKGLVLDGIEIRPKAEPPS